MSIVGELAVGWQRHRSIEGRLSPVTWGSAGEVELEFCPLAHDEPMSCSALLDKPRSCDNALPRLMTLPTDCPWANGTGILLAWLLY